MKKIITLFLVIGCIAVFWGCCNHEDDEYSYTTMQEITYTDFAEVNAIGQLSKVITFPSRARLETTENNTFPQGIAAVNVKETKSLDTGLNPIGNPDYIYIYDIKAIDQSGYETQENTLEKNMTLTLPTAHLGEKGICYAGIRDNEYSQWKYTRLFGKDSESGNSPSLIESSKQELEPTYPLGLSKVNVQVALFAYNKTEEEARNDISVAGIVATATPLLRLDNEDRYLDDLALNIKLTGDNLSRLTRSDVGVSIIYRTSQRTPATIKANGFVCSQYTENNNIATVNSTNDFVHILRVANFDASFGIQSEIAFNLELKGMSKFDFPTNFQIEVSNVGSVERLVPFNYSQPISFKAEKSKSPDPVPVVYTIAYNLNGGNLVEGDMNPDSYSETSETFTLENPVKAGYTFAGWTGTGLTAATKVVTIVKGSKGNREYTATWTENDPDTYNLIVKKGTGIASVSDNGSFKSGEEVTLNYTLEPGYEFDSWSSEEVLVDESDKFIMPANDVTVKANARVIVYNISYYGLEGATLGEGITNPSTYDVTTETITLNKPSKAGYTFAGWTGTDLDVATKEVSIAKGSTGNREYTATWTENAPDTYTLIINKGTGIATVSDGGSYTEGQEITLSYTLEEGYQFISWTSADVAVDSSNKFTMPAKAVTINANAGVVTYDIQYNGTEEATFEGGITNPVKYDVTSDTITLINPTKSAYTFIGWSGDGLTGDTNLTVTIPTGSTGNKTYTANWVPTSYEITYNLVDGILASGVTNPTSYDITSATITLNNPTRFGYDFNGWTGTGITEGTASTTVTIPLGSTGDRSYVASWTVSSILTFILPGDVTLEMRLCPHGSFTRSGAGGDNLEVTITKDYYMGTYEVTNAQYKAIMGAIPSDIAAAPNYNGDKKPVVYVTWNDIMQEGSGFIDKINTTIASQLPSGYKFSLPTEAQWEFACRAGTNTDFNNGTNKTADEHDPNLDSLAWNSDNWGLSNLCPHEVGGKLPNAFGLRDMHGNVCEWCYDSCDVVSETITPYDSENLTDPVCTTGSYRIIRGGGWLYGPINCTSHRRMGFTPGFSAGSVKGNIGFRLALVKE